jgi:hypothetical protein
MTPSDIPKVGFARAFNRILTQTRTPLRTWAKMNYKIFLKFLWKYIEYTSLILDIKFERNFVHWLSKGPERVNETIKEKTIILSKYFSGTIFM